MVPEHDYGQEYAVKTRPDQTGEEILVIPQGVRHYIERLWDQLELKMHIERGEYPLVNYQGLPMLPEPNYHLKGLRYLNLHTITFTRSMLEHLGYSAEVGMIMRQHQLQTRQQTHDHSQRL